MSVPETTAGFPGRQYAGLVGWVTPFRARLHIYRNRYTVRRARVGGSEPWLKTKPPWCGRA